MAKVFEKLQQRRNTTGGPVGLHTIVLAMGSYLLEVQAFHVKHLASLPEGDSLRQAFEPVAEEYRNFELAFTAFLKPPTNRRF